MSDLQDMYLRHRADGLTHAPAVEAVAMDTGWKMADVLAQLERQNALDVKDGTAPRSWRKPRRRQLHKIASHGIDRGAMA